MAATCASQGQDLPQRIAAVAAGGDQVEVHRPFDGGHDAVEVERMVVGDDDPDRFTAFEHENLYHWIAFTRHPE